MEFDEKNNWIFNFIQRTGKCPKLHEYPKEFLTYKQQIRVESFLRRHPKIVQELKEKEWREEELSKEIELEDLEGQVFDSKGRPKFERDGLVIDYEDEEDNSNLTYSQIQLKEIHAFRNK